MDKLLRRLCLALGTALLLAALLLIVHNLREDQRSGQQAAVILSDLQAQIPEPLPGEEPEESDPLPAPDLYEEFAPEPPDPEMPSLELDGSLYIGILSIPALDTALPVRADWSYPALKASPCRYSGSTVTGDLVLCAHNYRSHFGRIGELRSGDALLLTDVQGHQYRYRVLGLEQVAGTNIEQMQLGAAEDWDLTLFTCTLGGQSRVTVRAERIPN